MATTTVFCIGCDTRLGDDNAAVSCTEHPVCLGCDDPLQSCRDCRLEQLQVTTDHADDHAADQARDTREVNR